MMMNFYCSEQNNTKHGEGHAASLMIDVIDDWCLVVLKHVYKTIQFESSAEHETRQRQIRGKEGRTHAQTISADEGYSGRRKDSDDRISLFWNLGSVRAGFTKPKVKVGAS
jgi:hypothetical protein